MASTENEVLTSPDVMRILGIDKFRLSRMVRSGAIRPLPFDTLLEHPRSYRYSRQEVDRLLALRAERAQRFNFDTSLSNNEDSGEYRQPAAS